MTACPMSAMVWHCCAECCVHCVSLVHRERKLMYRVVFPFELKLPNTTDDAVGRDALYSLFAVVVHVGSGPHHGEAAAQRSVCVCLGGTVVVVVGRRGISVGAAPSCLLLGRY